MTAESEGAPRARRTWPQRLVLGVGVVLSLGTLAGAVGAAYAGWKFDQVEKYDLALSEAAPGEPANFLVVGSDSRESVDARDPNAGAFLDGAPGGQRSDTILVVRVDPEAESASMLSLPRDLWVPLPGSGEEQRINSAYGEGKQVLADTIEGYLGIPIHHYVEVDFRGFQGVVSAIGGIPMYFERAMKDTNSGLDVLHPGCVTLDGPAALAYARSRQLEYILRGEWHADPTGDLGRITRQQHLVRLAISRSVSRGLGNPLTLKRLVDVGVANVGIDDELSPSQLLDLGQRFQDFAGDDLVTHTLPVESFVTDGGANVLRLDAVAAVPTLDVFRDEKGAVPGGTATTRATTDPVEADVAVRVLNGSGVPKRAGNVAGALQLVGFTIAATGNVEDIGGADSDVTRILYHPDDQAAAELVVRHLSAGAELVEDADVVSGRPILVVGRDFTTVSAERLPAVVGTGDDEPTTSVASTTAPSSTTTVAPPGRTPGEPPPGVTCG